MVFVAFQIGFGVFQVVFDALQIGFGAFQIVEIEYVIGLFAADGRRLARHTFQFQGSEFRVPG